MGRGNLPDLSFTQPNPAKSVAPKAIALPQPNANDNSATTPPPLSQQTDCNNPVLNTFHPVDTAINNEHFDNGSFPAAGGHLNNDDPLSREHTGDDSLVATYAKDWVILGGERLSGITRVVAAPHDQVTIVFANGTRNIPASSLPSGFLDDWKITQDKLDAANQ
jgi:hypothetical protein